MSEKFIRALDAGDLAPGGMKAVELEGREIIICNSGGRFYAVDRRCGHMNAPLEKGTLDGIILTCAMHCAQFDVSTGEALSGPVPHDTQGETPPPKLARLLGNVGALMAHIRTNPVRTFKTKVESGAVWVCLRPRQTS